MKTHLFFEITAEYFMGSTNGWGSEKRESTSIGLNTVDRDGM